MQMPGGEVVAEIRKEAAAWLIQMDAHPEDWSRRAFVEWLKQSPTHMEEFQFAASLWLALHGAERLDLEALRQMAQTSNVTELPVGRRSVPDRDDPPSAEPKTHAAAGQHRRWLAAVAASGLLIAGTWTAWTLHRGATQVLITSVGEQRIARLPDRSVVHLNTDSHIEIRFTDTIRDVRLLRGEALFTVERELSRPFRVRAEDVRVEALGTQFNVRRRQADTIVSVIEGRVALLGATKRGQAAPGGNPRAVHSSQPTASGVARTPTYEADRPPPPEAVAVVGAGEQIEVSGDGRIEERPIRNIVATTAWQRRILMLDDMPLTEVVAEIARYNVSPHIRIEGERLQARRISGVFAVDSPESLIEFLARDPAVVVHRRGEQVTIGPR